MKNKMIALVFAGLLALGAVACSSEGGDAGGTDGGTTTDGGTEATTS